VRLRLYKASLVLGLSGYFFMQSVLIVVHLLIVLALAIVILLQRSEGGLGLGGGASSSASGLMSGRGQANALTRATAILGTLFFLTSLALAVLANRTGQSSVIKMLPEGQTQPASPQAPNQDGNFLDNLRRLQGDVPASAPAQIPAAPTAPQAPISR
jgi:preprotein translocase subunit SecG